MTDRLPPHSPEAEQSVLGAIMLDPVSAMGRCAGTFRGSDVFYDLRHQTIYSEMAEMNSAMVSIDLVTLSQRLKDRGILDQVGGLEYLSHLPDLCPSSYAIDDYIAIVQDKFLLRSMIQVCTSSVARIYDYEGDVPAIIDEVEKDILRVRQSLVISKNQTAKELTHGAINTIEKMHQGKGVYTGISTGFTDLDKLTWGFQRGDMVVIAARPSIGKAQPLDSLILTPSGFVEMQYIKPGSFVIGHDGQAVRVAAVFPQGKIPVFKVLFSDHTETRCSEEHLWFTQTRNERRRRITGSVKTLYTIRESVGRPGIVGSPNHVIPTVAPVNFASFTTPLPLHPWLLGALLGDGSLFGGCVSFSKPEVDLQRKVHALLPKSDTSVFATRDKMTIRIKRKKRSNSKSETKKVIVDLGLVQLSENKFIPQSYLLTSPSDRLELLRGLLDTDGYVFDSGNAVEFSSSSPKLAAGVAWIARSLGGICSEAKPKETRYSYKGEIKNGLPAHRMTIWFTDSTIIPVTSLKHLKKWKHPKRHCHKSIKQIVPDGEAECQCVQIESVNGLYVTDDFILTHNTSLAMNFVEHAAVEQQLPVGVFSLEMTAESLMLRMLCSRARVNLRNVREGFLAERDFPKLTAAAGKLAKAPIQIDASSSLSIQQLCAKARRMWQEHKIQLFVIDYLQLLNNSSARRHSDNRQQEVADISSGIKSLAKDLNVPIIVLSQLNRDVEREKNRKPRLSDLRESGAVEQDADFVGLLYRPASEEAESEDQDQDAVSVNLLVAKQRNGPTGDVPLTFLKSYTRFESAAKASKDYQQHLPHND